MAGQNGGPACSRQAARTQLRTDDSHRSADRAAAPPGQVAPTRRRSCMRGAMPAPQARCRHSTSRREHAEALFPQPFRSARFAADDLAALHGQRRGDPPLLRRAQGLRTTVCGKPMRLWFFSTSHPAQEGQRLRQQALRPAAGPAGVAAERKDLGIGLRSSRLLQVDMAGIPFQPLPARPELIGGVAVSVKQLHEKMHPPDADLRLASSACRSARRPRSHRSAALRLFRVLT